MRNSSKRDPPEDHKHRCGHKDRGGRKGRSLQSSEHPTQSFVNIPSPIIMYSLTLAQKGGYCSHHSESEKIRGIGEVKWPAWGCHTMWSKVEIKIPQCLRPRLCSTLTKFTVSKNSSSSGTWQQDSIELYQGCRNGDSGVHIIDYLPLGLKSFALISYSESWKKCYGFSLLGTRDGGQNRENMGWGHICLNN